MRSVLTIFLLLIPFLAFGQPMLLKEGKVIDTLESVELISQDKFNAEGEKFGVDYFVQNQNAYPIYVVLETVNPQNVYTNFPSSQFIVDSGEKVYIGWVVQVDGGETSQWEVEWRIEK